MKFYTVLLDTLLVISGFAQVNLKKATKYANEITPALLKQHLTVVASAEMEGRETATEGQRKAALYLEQVMKEIGLKPAKDGNYQVPYPVYRDSILNVALTIDKITLGAKEFVAPASNHTAALAFGEVVHLDFADTAWIREKIDVAGKLVMFKPSRMRNQSKTRAILTNINAVMKRGAAAALVIDSVDNSAAQTGSMSLSEYPARQSINYYLISPEVGELIMKKKPDTSRLPARVYKANIKMEYEETSQQLESSNVIGYLEGTSKKDEFLVISAHYDHVGKKDSLIWYGADDDGSGTVAVLSLAKAFAKAKAEGSGPERSILFVLFSGEEKGLWGSQTYTSNPIFPFDKTTANLNIDMIGRVDSVHIKNDTLNYIYLVGDDKLSSELAGIAKAANAFTKLELNAKYNDPKDPEKIYTRSDHYNFAKHGVPVIFYYDGGNPDYHRVTDTVDKIDFDLMAKRTKLIFYTAWEMTNRNNLLVRDKPLD